MMFGWLTKMNQIALISAMVENSFVNGDDPFNAIILCGNVFARKPISDAFIGLIMHEQKFSEASNQKMAPEAITL